MDKKEILELFKSVLVGCFFIKDYDRDQELWFRTPRPKELTKDGLCQYEDCFVNYNKLMENIEDELQKIQSE